MTARAIAPAVLRRVDGWSPGGGITGPDGSVTVLAMDG
jgi:hypothetical protein